MCYDISVTQGFSTKPAFGTFNALFLYPQDPDRIEEMIGIVRDEVLIDLPDTQAFVQRSKRLAPGLGSLPLNAPAVVGGPLGSRTA